MLQFLHIENIAVIEKADIELKNGFNVLTGETGAGKSIIIDSINAILGERTSKELIREGAQKAEVSAIFADLNIEAVDILNNYGYELDSEGKLLISRVLSYSGSSVKINGKPATVGTLREIGQYIINIHGQFDNQNLLNPQIHGKFIDMLADCGKELSDYYYEFKNINSIRKELSSLETDEEEKMRQAELLKYQISEIEQANISVGEIAELKEKQKIAEQYEKTVSAIFQIEQLLNGNDNNNGIITDLKFTNKLLSSLNIKNFEKDAARLSETVFTLNEISDNLRFFAENNDFSQNDIDLIGERLDLLRRLVLKYGGDEEKTLEYLKDSKEKLSNIVNSDKRINELSIELENATERLIFKAHILTELRKKAAQNFESAVTDVLKYLDMPNVVFKVSFNKGRYTKNGCDEIEFFINTNAGESVKPLHKIASGGELSRVMLAIKSVLSEKDLIDTLIFDEIDSGISGFAASKVGVRLKNVSKNRQVLCVTHLAQIAGFADEHFLISKTTDNGRVYTNVVALTYEERIKEIARIMSGSKITDSLYNSAKELLDRSIENENL